MSSKLGTATFIRQDNGTGDGRIYKLDPPMPYVTWGDDGEEELTTEYVWVSAADAFGSGPETYIFPCNETGEVLDWGELDGSFRGGLDHARALQTAGYTVREKQPA